MWSLLLVFVSAFFVWSEFFKLGEFTAGMTGYLIAGVVVTFILAIVTVFNKKWSPYTVPIYALLEGAILGLLSAFFEMMFPGIVMQAVMLTFGVFLVMLYLFKSRII